MDRQAAVDYHAALMKRLRRKDSALDRLIWVPILGVSGWYAFGTLSGAAFGALLGWGICAILSTLDSVAKQIWHAEWLRHLHEHTDEAESGEARADRDERLDLAIRRWWQF
jgi:hypothetical protein